MSTFPGSNLNVISGIDPIGAGFLGGEVQRLQSDTENKRNTETARRGQDQQMQLEQQQMAQQAQQQAAQMQMAKEQFDRQQEAAQTENALNRGFQTDVLSYQDERADSQRLYDAAVATGDVEGQAVARAKLEGVRDRLKEKNKKAGALSILHEYQKGLMDPSGDGHHKAMADVLNQISTQDQHQFTFLKGLADSITDGIKTADNDISNREKGLDAVRAGGVAGAIREAMKGQPPALVELAVSTFQAAGEGALTHLLRGVGLGHVVNHIEAKLIGWIDNAVPGNLIQEDTPEEKVAKAMNHIARSTSGLMKVEGAENAEVEGSLQRMLKAAHTVATGSGDAREESLKMIRAEKDWLKSHGVTDAVLKTVIGTLNVTASARESGRMVGKVGGGPGGDGEVKGESSGDTRQGKINNVYERVSHALEEGTGLMYDRSSFLMGADGTVKYTGADLSGAELQSIFVDWMDGDLSDDENKRVFDRLGDRGTSLKKIIEPQVKMYLTRMTEMAKESGLPLEEVVERMGGPGMLPKFKNLASLHGIATEEAEGLGREQEGVKLDAASADKVFQANQRKRQAERDTDARLKFQALYDQDRKRQADRQKGL